MSDKVEKMNNIVDDIEKAIPEGNKEVIGEQLEKAKELLNTEYGTENSCAAETQWWFLSAGKQFFFFQIINFSLCIFFYWTLRRNLLTNHFFE